MKKRHSIHVLLAAAALLLATAACTKDKLNSLAGGVEENPVVIRATGLSAVATPASRATVDGDWQGVTSVALQMDDAVKAYTVTASADFKSATLASEDNPFYWNGHDEMTLSAWWPYDDADITRMPAVVVAGDQSRLDAFQGSDFISAINQKVEFDDPKLTFTHRTARVAVTLACGTAISSVEGATASLAGLSTADGNPAAITPYYHAGNDTYEALIAPQTVAAGSAFIQVQLNNKTYDYTPDEAVELEAGKRYTYTVRVNATGLTLAGCTIDSWESGGGEEGAAEDQGYTYDESTNTYFVYNADGLQAWAEAVIEDWSTNCTLTANIIMPAAGDGQGNWTLGALYYESYTGIFDGGGHSITGLVINEPDNAVGLFNIIGENGSVRNLTLTAVKYTGFSAGGIANTNWGTITDCVVSGTVTGTGDYVGGIVGDNYGTVTGCDVSVTVTGTSNVGGVLGSSWGTVTGCDVSGTVTGTNNVGGVAGVSASTITDCDVSVTVTGTGDYAGGIVGGNYGTITGCDVSVTVTGTGGGVGGVAGYSNGTVTGCNVSGSVTVTGTGYVGGIVGDNYGTIIACHSKSAVTGTVTVGGIAGCNYGTVTGCDVSGTVTGTDIVGGVLGRSGGTVTACYWANNQSLGIGYGSGDVTQVDGSNVTWVDAANGMNAAIDAWNLNHPDNLCNWRYDEGTAPTTPPTLVENDTTNP